MLVTPGAGSQETLVQCLTRALTHYLALVKSLNLVVPHRLQLPSGEVVLHYLFKAHSGPWMIRSVSAKVGG